MKRISTLTAAAALLLSSMMLAAPAQASGKSSCYYFTPGGASPGTAAGSWCAQATPGTHQRIKITCKLPYSPYTTTVRYGPWKYQGGGYTSIAHCPSSHYVSEKTIQLA